MTEKHTDKRTILIVDDDADLSMLSLPENESDDNAPLQ